MFGASDTGELLTVIVHCSKKLAAKLPEVSPVALTETSPLGSWHAHLFVMDRRQCVLFCHDMTRYALFLPGLRKEQFAVLDNWFRQLYCATLAEFGCAETQINKVELALGPVRYDTVTDRSVQGSIRIMQFDLEYKVHDEGDVMRVDPLAMSCELSDRPATVYGKFVWPKKEMLALIERL